MTGKKPHRRFDSAVKDGLRNLPGYLILGAWCAFTLYLLSWVVAASFSTTKEIFSGNVFAMSSGVHFENYVSAWTTSKVSVFFGNSILYTAVTLVGSIAICAPASYALARFRFRGNRLIQVILVASMSVPGIMVILPLFQLVARAGVMNNAAANRVVLILLYIGTKIAYTTIFLYNFFTGLSCSYEEAAAIDGCSPVRAFWQIMLPMAKGGIATVSIFNFLGVWNEYFMSLIMAGSDKVKPVAIGLHSLINSMKYTGNWAGMFAAVVIVTLPCIILYLCLSEKIIGGVTGGVKG